MGMFDFNNYDGRTHDDWGMPIKKDRIENQELIRRQERRIAELENRIRQLENELSNNKKTNKKSN